MSPALFFAALVSAMFINNIILIRFLGICSFLGVSKKIEAAAGMAAAVIFVMLLANAITYFIFYGLLVPLELEYLRTLAFILVIAAIVQFVEMFLKKFSAPLYKSLGIYLPLITTNCAILGIAEGSIISNFFGDFGFWGGFAMSMTTALGTALGYSLIIFAFSAIRVRLDSMDVPPAFKGVPVSLLIAAIMSMAFLGLQGLV